MNMDKLNKTFNSMDNEAFEKTGKITGLEITHSFILDVKEKDLEIAEMQRKRTSSRV